MRTALTLAILATASVAGAEPLSVQSTTPGEDAPHTYFAPGIAFGSAGNHTMSAVSMEIGTRVTDHLVLDLEGLSGTDGEALAGSGTYVAGMLGLDATTCQTVTRVCGYVGFSVGYASSTYDGTGWLGDGMSTLSQGGVGMVRAGLDIGSKHVRWRPGLQAAVVGPSEGALTQSIAFTF